MTLKSGNYVELNILEDDAYNAIHSGNCDFEIKELSEKRYIKEQTAKLNTDALASELREYGAWDEKELKDHAQNIQRILWIFAGDIKEGNI